MRYFRNEHQKLLDILSGGKHFLILTHIDPDGDALGAAFGLAYILKKMKKQPVVGLNAPLARKYEFLNIDEGIKVILPERLNLSRLDGLLVLDLGDLKRLDRYSEPVRELLEGGEKGTPALPVVNIDHHPDNTRFGTFNIVDSNAASTSQMILEIFGSRMLDKRSALRLYTGIVYDTGGFRHGKNMKRVHEAAVICLNHEIDTKFIHDQLFAIETEGSLRLFSRALSRLVLSEKGRVAHMYLNADDYRELKLSGEDSAGFINRMLLLEGAQLVIFFNETEKNNIKISLRSNTDFNVGEFASKFGGGGHEKASGCVIEGNLEKVMDKVLKSLRLALDPKKS